MSKILVLVHTESDGSLAKSAFEAVGAAKALGEPFAVGLVGEDVQKAADALAGCGAEKFLGVSGAEFAQPRYATDAAAAEALAKTAGADIVIAPGTSRWNRVLAGAAHRLGGAIDKHVTAIDSDLKITRGYYRARIVAKMTRTQRPWFIVLDPGAAAPLECEAGSASVETISAGAQSRTKVQGIVAPEAGEQTIRPDAETLFVAGAGWTKKQPDGKLHVAEAQEIILGFVHGAKASLGSSKSLVDQKGEGQEVLTCMTHLNQVGQTGSTPRHPKGLATCCHGEEPHVVGWRFINERRAINLDANCGWAQGKADVLYIADAFEVMKKVNELL